MMRFSINIPNFGDFAEAQTVARVASAAEAAGWDGLFVWDHVVHTSATGGVRRSLDAPHRRGVGDDADQAGPPGHPGRSATAAAARPPGVDPGQPERRAGDLRRRVGRPDRGRVRQLRRADRPEAARRALGRGPAPPGPVLVRRVGDARRSPLPGSGRDPAAHAGATAARAGLDRRVLAASRTDATRRPMGRAPSRCSCPRRTATRRRSTRSATWSHTSALIATANQSGHSSSSWADRARPIPRTHATCSVR